LNLDNHNRIPTSYLRLLRRIVRDYETRNSSVQRTLSMWDSVRRGEKRWIFPYQENADVMFNSALLFELAIIKDYAEPILRKVPNNRPEYSEAYRLRKFLAYFVPLQDKELPPTSLLREFLGGSSFRY
jgi:uridine kinase